MGLYFELLPVDSDLIYERRGRIQRKGRMRQEWHHHRDAIRIPESVFASFSDAFRKAHPGFNYCGPTEYKVEETIRLCSELRAGPWAARSGNTQDETEDAIQRILAVAEHALANRQSLLVLGI